jgi:hypothetical protein
MHTAILHPLYPQESLNDEDYFCKFFQFLLMASKREIPKVLKWAHGPVGKDISFTKRAMVLTVNTFGVPPLTTGK